MTFFYSCVLFLSAMVGGVIYILTNKRQGAGLKLLLSFSAAYLLGLSLLHLMPELFHSGLAHPGWFILAGFILQVILDFFSHGIEHGHAHIHEHTGSRYLITIMGALWIHAFLEGMPFGGDPEEMGHVHDHGHAHSHDHRGSLLLGISLHKITEALVFTALLLANGMSKLRAIFWLAVFALMAPAGAVLHHILVLKGATMDGALGAGIIGILVGILLHVSTTILFESESGHRFNLLKFATILAGIALSALFAI